MDYTTITIKLPLNKIDTSKHNKNHTWSNVYMLKRMGDRDKELICYDGEDDIEYVATSTISYKHECFYKDSVLSNKSPIFDYYKVLKMNTPKCVGSINKKWSLKKNHVTKEHPAGLSVTHSPVVVDFE